ncbi:MAG: hypothetical protein IJQ77_10400, partial [Synergistaceae bacterium]|nr:hypothetical protein [Synergistaceae bacterium]
LRQAVQGVTDLITKSGFVNLDFADIKAILTGAGTAIMGMGEGEGEDRARKAAQSALDSPLMTMPVTGAKGILLNVSTGAEIMLSEMADAASIIEERADTEAQVIWGHVIDETLGEKVHVTLIATFPDGGDHVPIIKPKVTEKPENKSGQGQTQQPPVIQVPVQQGIIQTPQRGRTLYDLYNMKRRQQEGFEEARLTSPNEDENSAFPKSQRRLYDQPAIFRQNRKN